MNHVKNAELRGFISLAAPLVAVCAFFWRPLFTDENFVYRDAGHFYYPLYKIVADQWDRGWWPLWNPYENGGSPLLANPAAAVLYPVRIVCFQWCGLSYGLAYKFYIVGHACLAALGAWWLARRLGLSRGAASLAASAYALSAAVAFQYCNVIFLVGAAWLPIALEAVDRIVSSGSLSAVLRLAFALVMQVLGGDPQAAYVALCLGLVYVCVRNPRYWVALLAAMSVWAQLKFHWPDFGSLLAGLTAIVGGTVNTAPVASHSRQRRALILLALGALIALGLTAAQWMPTLEFTARSRRAAQQGGHSPYGFDVPPWRLAEYVWPAVFGRQFSRNTRWVEVYYAEASRRLQTATAGEDREALMELSRVLPFEYDAATGSLKYLEYIWTPTLYSGILVPVLAVAGLRRWRLPRARWIATSAILLLLAGLGRWGLVYPLMVHGLPGFDAFRYPAKMLVPAALMLALLGGYGLDAVRQERRAVRLVLAVCASLLLVSCILLALWISQKEVLTLSWARSIVARATSHYGPLVVDVAWTHGLLALVHGCAAVTVAAATLMLLHWRKTSGVLTAVLVFYVMDVALANRWLIVTADQGHVDQRPRALRHIAEDARARRLAGPFRIFRAAEFTPQAWWTTSDANRAVEIFLWEKHTIQPKYAEPWGGAYAITETTLESYDYWWFFAPFFSNVLPGRVVYYPKKGFDLWGTRYLILPTRFNASDEKTAFASLAEGCEVVYRSMAPDEDYQILHNPHAYPRAWLVHEVEFHPPIRGLRREDRMELMRRLLYPGPNPWWSEPALDDNVFDPSRTAVVETDHPDSFPRIEPRQGEEQVIVLEEFPPVTRIFVKASSPALLVMADAFFPGWRVAVDGNPASLYRVNRMMRGVVVPKGEHEVTLVYEPASFSAGTKVSMATAFLVFLALVTEILTGLGRSLRRPRVPDST